MGKSILFAGIALGLLYGGWGVGQVLSGREGMQKAWEGMAKTCQVRQEVATQYIEAAAAALDDDRERVQSARVALERAATSGGRLVVPETSREFRRFCEVQDELTQALVLLASVEKHWSEPRETDLAAIEADLSRSLAAFAAASHRYELAIAAFPFFSGGAPVRSASGEKLCCTYERVSITATERL
jgi:hypothetical protein